MVTVEEAKSNIAQARQQIATQKQSVEEARSKLSELKQRLPQTQSQQALRSKYSSLRGRDLRRQVQQSKEQIGLQEEDISRYEEGLARYEEEQIAPVELEVKDYEERQKAQEVVSSAFETVKDEGGETYIPLGKLQRLTQYGNKYEKEYAEEVLKQIEAGRSQIELTKPDKTLTTEAQAKLDILISKGLSKDLAFKKLGLQVEQTFQEIPEINNSILIDFPREIRTKDNVVVDKQSFKDLFNGKEMFPVVSASAAMNQRLPLTGVVRSDIRDIQPVQQQGNLQLVLGGYSSVETPTPSASFTKISQDNFKNLIRPEALKIPDLRQSTAFPKELEQASKGYREISIRDLSFGEIVEKARRGETLPPARFFGQEINLSRADLRTPATTAYSVATQVSGEVVRKAFTPIDKYIPSPKNVYFIKDDRTLEYETTTLGPKAMTLDVRPAEQTKFSEFAGRVTEVGTELYTFVPKAAGNVLGYTLEEVKEAKRDNKNLLMGGLIGFGGLLESKEGKAEVVTLLTLGASRIFPTSLFSKEGRLGFSLSKRNEQLQSSYSKAMQDLTNQEREIAKIRQKRYELNMGQRDILPSEKSVREFSLYEGKATDYLSRNQILQVDDLIGGFNLQTGKNLPRVSESSFISLRQVEVGLPKELTLIKGSLGDIPKIVKLPQLKYSPFINEPLRVRTGYISLGAEGKVVGKEIGVGFQLNRLNKPIGYNIQVSTYNPTKKITQTRFFRQGRKSVETIKTSIGEFKVVKSQPIIEEPRAYVKRLSSDRLIISEEPKIIATNTMEEIRLYGKKVGGKSPFDITQAISSPAKKSFAKDFLRGKPLGTEYSSSISTVEEGSFFKMGAKQEASLVKGELSFGDKNLIKTKGSSFKIGTEKQYDLSNVADLFKEKYPAKRKLMKVSDMIQDKYGIVSRSQKDQAIEVVQKQVKDFNLANKVPEQLGGKVISPTADFLVEAPSYVGGGLIKPKFSNLIPDENLIFTTTEVSNRLPGAMKGFSILEGREDLVGDKILIKEDNRLDNVFKDELIFKGDKDLVGEIKVERAIINNNIKIDSIQKDFQRMTPIQNLNLRQIQDTQQKSKQVNKSKQSIKQTIIKQPTPKIKKGTLKIPLLNLPDISLKKSKMERIVDSDEFKLFVAERGKDVKKGSKSTKEEALSSLIKILRGTKAASGYLESKGRKLKVSELGISLGGEFIPSKRDSFRLVQRKERRLGTKSEISDVQYFKTKKKSRGGLFGL